MKTLVLCVALLTALALPVGTASSVGKPEDVGLSSERLQRVAQMIQRRIAAGDLAGAVVAVARKGRLAYVNAQGVMDLETKQPMTPSAMFRIASMTKPVVGVGIMMMVEEGKLRLNDPVSRYIPEFRGMKVPEMLLSGHHAEIEQWRAEQARQRTARRRPDLLKDDKPL